MLGFMGKYLVTTLSSDYQVLGFPPSDQLFVSQQKAGAFDCLSHVRIEKTAYFMPDAVRETVQTIKEDILKAMEERVLSQNL